MKYDVFISYSRRNFDEVSAFVKMLQTRIPTLTCFFDIKEIESGDEEFDETIISAINESSYVLFAASENSMQSKWAKSEIAYAQNIGKKVIPVLLDGAELEEGWFLFKFGRIDCIDSTNPIQVEKLINNLATWTSKQKTSVVLPLDGRKVRVAPKRVWPYLLVAAVICLSVFVTTKFDKIAQKVSQVLEAKSVMEAVDLGLSSGTLWSKCNLGAANEYEPGEFYEWGSLIPNKQLNPEERPTMDNVIGTEYDPAFKTLGKKWSLPSGEQMSELISQCKWEWQEDKTGYLVTGPNGNSIFMPVAGSLIDQAIQYKKERGYYWTGEADTTNVAQAKEVLIWGNVVRVQFGAKNVGRSIRAVCSK